MQLMHCAFMASITIRDVPDDTRIELASRASVSGRSLQEYLLLHLIEFADQPDKSALVRRIGERKSRAETRVTTDDVLEALRADRR